MLTQCNIDDASVAWTAENDYMAHQLELWGVE